MKQISQILFIGLFIFIFSSCSKDGVNQEDFEMEQLEAEAAQNNILSERKCHAHDLLEAKIANDPDVLRRRQALEEHTRNFIANSANTASSRSVITIPVVVHVLWKTTAQNVSDAQINSQLDVLNEDFRRLNSDASDTPAAFAGVAADTEIEFCLASQDPNGNATSGITRRQTTKNSFNPDTEDIKHVNNGGQDGWDSGKYLNIWVGNISQDVLGWATFPEDNAGDEDGVVITTAAFGTMGTAQAPFNLGRTGTHEVGHWLNLYHIWGDGGCGVDDEINDTPASDAANYGCASGHTSCGSTDMVQNYMDYSDDGCMNLFTNGQKARMQALFASGGARASLLNSNGCNGAGGGTGGGTGGGGNENEPCEKPTGLSAGNVNSSSATVTWNESNNALNYRIRYRIVGTTAWTFKNNIDALSYTLTGLDNNTEYQVRVQARCEEGLTVSSISAFFTTTATSGGGNDDEEGCSNNYEPNNARSAATVTTPDLAGDKTSMIATDGDRDWFEFNNSAAKSNIKVVLRNLPADYDIYLYRGSELIDYSEREDQRTEVITYNTQVVGTYRVKVVGYDGAHDNDACYELRVRTKSSNFRLQEMAVKEASQKMTQTNIE